MNDLVSVALSQVGYVNKASNAYLDSNTANPKNGYNGYTKYGAWYGLNPAPWCGIFISWCGYTAGCLDKVGGKIAYVPNYTAYFNGRGKYRRRGSYTPVPGDIVIFGDEAHVGIVEKAMDGYLYTIEGNANNGRVARNRYNIYDEYIMGYCITGAVEEEHYPEVTIQAGTYKNGSTPESVYYKSDLSPASRLGELNRWETCMKIGKCGDLTMVIYPVDGEHNMKIGFVEYEGGS